MNNDLCELNMDSIKKFAEFSHADLNVNSVEELINKEQILKLNLKYAIIYNFDSVFTGRTEDAVINISNITEARFFNNMAELKVFNKYKLHGSIFMDNGDKDAIKKEYLIRRSDKVIPKKISVKEYIDYDDDNQAYVYYSKPVEFIYDGRVEK